MLFVCRNSSGVSMASSEEFREFGKEMIDYVADYLDNIRDRPVFPQVNKECTLDFPVL